MNQPPTNALGIRTTVNPRKEQQNQRRSSKLTSPLPKDFNVPRAQVADGFSQIGALKVLVHAVLEYLEAVEQRIATNDNYRFDLQSEVRSFESEIIRSALIKTGGRQRRAARLLGMKATTFNAKVKAYNLNPQANKSVETQ